MVLSFIARSFNAAGTPSRALCFSTSTVYDDAFRLQVLDFDIAVLVDDDEAVIARYRGAEGCAAPEVGKGEEGGAGLEVQTVRGVRVVV